MYKFYLYILILFYSLEIDANENCSANDPDLTALCNTLETSEDLLNTMLLLAGAGVVLMVATGGAGLGAEAGNDVEDTNSELTYYLTGDKIVFEGHHRFENLEINFSNPVKLSEYQKFYQQNDDHYIGFTWRF
jgi:hypothetical protein